MKELKIIGLCFCAVLYGIILFYHDKNWTSDKINPSVRYLQNTLYITNNDSFDYSGITIKAGNSKYEVVLSPFVKIEEGKTFEIHASELSDYNKVSMRGFVNKDDIVIETYQGWFHGYFKR
ncbi:S1 domain-containing protein [Aquirufa sp. ROCK-SH2]